MDFLGFVFAWMLTNSFPPLALAKRVPAGPDVFPAVGIGETRPVLQGHVIVPIPRHQDFQAFFLEQLFQPLGDIQIGFLLLESRRAHGSGIPPSVPGIQDDAVDQPARLVPILRGKRSGRPSSSAAQGYGHAVRAGLNLRIPDFPVQQKCDLGGILEREGADAADEPRFLVGNQGKRIEPSPDQGDVQPFIPHIGRHIGLGEGQGCRDADDAAVRQFLDRNPGDVGQKPSDAQPARRIVVIHRAGHDGIQDVEETGQRDIDFFRNLQGRDWHLYHLRVDCDKGIQRGDLDASGPHRENGFLVLRIMPDPQREQPGEFIQRGVNDLIFREHCQGRLSCLVCENDLYFFRKGRPRKNAHEKREKDEPDRPPEESGPDPAPMEAPGCLRRGIFNLQGKGH